MYTLGVDKCDQNKSRYRTFPVTPKRWLVPIPRYSVPYSPSKNLFYFLLLSVWLSLEFNINIILQYEHICVCLLSFSIMFSRYAIVYINIGKFCIVLVDYSFIHSPVDSVIILNFSVRCIWYVSPYM